MRTNEEIIDGVVVVCYLCIGFWLQRGAWRGVVWLDADGGGV